MFGTPIEKTWPGITKLPEYKLTFPQFHERGLSCYNKNIDNVGLDLLWKMIQINSAKRALEHPFFDDLDKS